MIVRVVTEKVNGGWQVRIVSTTWDPVVCGWTLNGIGYFGPDLFTFKSRRLARMALRLYAAIRPSIKFVGGLH